MKKLTTEKLTPRCGAHIPGGYQCKLKMYHAPEPCVFFPERRFSTYLEVDDVQS